MKSDFVFVSGLVIGGLLFTALEEWVGGWAVALLYLLGLPAMSLLLYRWVKSEKSGQSDANE